MQPLTTEQNRLTEFFEEKDTELLLGAPVEPERFCDTHLGRSMDKIAVTLINELLTNISKYMAEHGLRPGADVYVADAAFVTEDTLDRSEGQTWFLTCLPANYNECNRMIRVAVASDGWIGIEKNFSFLKDPAIVNSIFLKKAERIEVLGLVLLISLLIWRLMERSIGQYVEANDCTLPGWVRRQTKKPTTFVMTTKFTSVMVITIGQHRQLAKPLKPFQKQYLTAMGATVDAFAVP